MPAAIRSPDRTPRLRIGVAGAGLIAQVEHLPNLVALPDRFDLVAVVDPSAAVRDAVAGRYGVRLHADVEALLGEPLDAIVVAVPDALHAGTVLRALDAGLHVLCEKPLCIDDADYARIAEARDRTGRVVQVGYMKRFDPNYEAALAELPVDGAATLRYLSVEVHDPDAWPFVAHRPLTRADDVPPALGEETRATLHRQAVAALGVEPDAEALAGFTNTLMSGVVHCVNAGHGPAGPHGRSGRRGGRRRHLARGRGRRRRGAPAGGRAHWRLARRRCRTSPSIASATRCGSTTASWSSSSRRRTSTTSRRGSRCCAPTAATSSRARSPRGSRRPSCASWRASTTRSAASRRSAIPWRRRVATRSARRRPAGDHVHTRRTAGLNAHPRWGARNPAQLGSTMRGASTPAHPVDPSLAALETRKPA